MGKLDSNDSEEFVGQIVDIFEDYLTEEGIILRNEDREQKVWENKDGSPEEIAIIYGDKYDFVAEPVRKAIELYNLTESALKSESAMEDVQNRVFQGFKQLLTDGGYLLDIPKEDAERLKDKVQETFVNWGLYEVSERSVSPIEEEGQER